MMTARRRFVAALFTTLLAAPSAFADTPAFLDDIMEPVCSALQTAESCPTCKCEPITQSNPTQDWADATDIPMSTLVLVTGKVGERHIKSLHVVAGSEKLVIHGGRVTNMNSDNADVKSDFKVVRSMQTYDMCPGACDWLSVGAVHLFEIEVFKDEPTEEPETERHQSRTRELVTCYMANDEFPMQCFATNLAFEQRTFYPKKKRQKRFKGWKRTWKIGGEFGMSLVFSRFRGALAKSLKKEPVGKNKRKCHFYELGPRGDTVLLTEPGQGGNIAFERPTRIPKAGQQ